MRYSVIALVLIGFSVGGGCDQMPQGISADMAPNSDLSPVVDPSCMPLLNKYTTCLSAVKDQKDLYSCEIDPLLFQRCKSICPQDRCKVDSPPNMQGSYQQKSELAPPMMARSMLVKLDPDNSNITIAGSTKLMVNDSPEDPIFLPAKVFGSKNHFTVYRYTQLAPCNFELMAISGELPTQGPTITCDQIRSVSVQYLRFQRCQQDSQFSKVVADGAIYNWNRVLDPKYPPSCTQ